MKNEQEKYIEDVEQGFGELQFTDHSETNDMIVEQFYASKRSYDPFNAITLLVSVTQRLCKHCLRKKNKVACGNCFVKRLPDLLVGLETNEYGFDTVHKTEDARAPFNVEIVVVDDDGNEIE